MYKTKHIMSTCISFASEALHRLNALHVQFMDAVLDSSLELPYEQVLDAEIDSKLGNLKDLLLHCLQRDPAARPTMDQFMTRLHALVEGLKDSPCTPDAASALVHPEAHRAGRQAHCSSHHASVAQQDLGVQAHDGPSTSNGTATVGASSRIQPSVSTAQDSTFASSSHASSMQGSVAYNYASSSGQRLQLKSVGQLYREVCARLSASIGASQRSSSGKMYGPYGGSSMDVQASLPSSACAQLLDVSHGAEQSLQPTSERALQAQLHSTDQSRPQIRVARNEGAEHPNAHRSRQYASTRGEYTSQQPAQQNQSIRHQRDGTRPAAVFPDTDGTASSYLGSSAPGGSSVATDISTLPSTASDCTTQSEEVDTSWMPASRLKALNFLLSRVHKRLRPKVQRILSMPEEQIEARYGVKLLSIEELHRRFHGMVLAPYTDAANALGITAEPPQALRPVTEEGTSHTHTTHTSGSHSLEPQVIEGRLLPPDQQYSSPMPCEKSRVKGRHRK